MFGGRKKKKGKYGAPTLCDSLKQKISTECILSVTVEFVEEIIVVNFILNNNDKRNGSYRLCQNSTGPRAVCHC